MERTRFSRFTSMLLAVIMILSSFTVMSVTSTEVSAADNTDNKVTVSEISTNIKWARTVSFIEPVTGEMLTYYQGQTRHQLRVDGTNKVAYCIQPGLFLHELSTGKPVSLDEDRSKAWDTLPDDVKKSLKYPLFFGYPNDGYPNENTDLVGSEYKLTGTAAEKEVATQLIIWELVCGYRKPFSSKDPNSFELIDTRFADGMFGTSRDQNTGVLANYNKIVAATIRFLKTPSFSEKSATKAPTYTMKWENGAYRITLTDTNGVLNNYAMQSSDPDVKFSQSGNKLTVTTTKALTNPVSVKSETKGTISEETNNTVVYGSTNPDIQDVMCSDVKPDPVQSFFRLTTEATGSFRVEKKYLTPDGVALGTNVTSSMLLGTKFVVKNSSGKYVKATYPGSGITYTYSGFADTEAGGSAFYPKKSGSSFVFDITKLPPDTYTVMEKDPGTAGFYIAGSSIANASVTPNDSGGKKTAEFQNRTSQLTIDKNFIQYDAVTDNDYRNVAVQVTQGSSTTPLKVKLIDAATNTYLYDTSSTLTKLTFRTPSVHSITIVGLPIKNSSGTPYTYTVSELPTGQVTGTAISKRYTYNSVTKTFSGTPVVDGTIDNTEKDIGEIEITKTFRIRNTDGTMTDFNGADGLSLQQAYSDISFLVKNSEGKYVKAVTSGNAYSFRSLADSKSEATEFKINSTSKKIRITDLPFGKYTVTEVIGGSVRGYGFNTQGSSSQYVTTKYDISSDKVVVGEAKFINFKDQHVGLKIHKTFTDKDDTAVDISDKLYSQMEFTVSYNSNAQRFVLENEAKGTYHLYRGASGETPVTVLKLGTDTHEINIDGLNSGSTYTVTEKITGTALKSLSYCDYSYTVENGAIKNYLQADENILVQSNTVKMPQGDNSTAEIYFNNTFKTTEIKIYKESDDDLVEIKFAVITENYDLYPESAPLYVKTKPTTVNGRVRGEASVSGLPFGYYDEANDTVVPIRYRIQEVHTPPYYEIPEAQVIVPKNGVKSVTFKNELKKGTIKVIKTAEVNGKTTTIPLPNVEFKLTNDYNNTVLTGKTNSKGELLFENLPVAVGKKESDGTESFHKIQYTVSEQSSDANSAYVLAEDQTITFSYTAEQAQRYKELSFINKPILGSVQLEKADKETKELLSGAVFRIYNDVNGNGKLDVGTDTLATGYLTKNGTQYHALVEKMATAIPPTLDGGSRLPKALLCDIIIL